MDRKSGVLMHISSLPGDYSIGSFGHHAKRFVDLIQGMGFTYWQVLPFCMLDTCNSPYQSYSAFGGNPYFVDLDILHQEGLLTKEELDAQKQQTPYSCEYGRLYHTRVRVLAKAAARAKNREEIEQFIAKDSYLSAFCRFMALKAANNQAAWFDWQNDSVDETVLFTWKFIQYQFFAQWAEIKRYANERGIKIIGDVPIYVSLDSADVWSNKDLFSLDTGNRPKSVAGVPPDYFCADGQLWGNPIYDWAKMKEDGYRWWLDRMDHMFSMFDGVRIDHFRGLESYWAVPGTAETAREGKWEKGPGMELVEKIHALQGSNMVIAEDLGDITEDVIRLVEKSGFPGMRVFQFAFLGEGDTPHLPHHYESNTVAYTGTHDNNTLLGYLWELDEHTRRRMLEYCGYTDPNWEAGYDSILRTMFASHAGLLILPIQDLLGYGSDTRLNIPGKADGNWQFRVTEEQLSSIDKHKFKRLHELYKR